MFKNQKIILSLLAIGLAILPFSVLAQGGLYESSNVTIESLGVSIGNAIWIIFTIIAVICFIAAGIIFLTAFGDPEKVKTARSAVLWGVVGIIVAIMAYGIVAMIRSIIGA
jgi:hypothetical protein